MDANCATDSIHQRILQCIQDRELSITRRSAGIPSLVVGILSAEPDGTLFAKAIHILRQLALSPTVDHLAGGVSPQVHALNCLKAIFTNASLGRSSEKYIADGLELA